METYRQTDKGWVCMCTHAYYNGRKGFKHIMGSKKLK